MKKLLLASVLAIASFPGFAEAKPITQCDIEAGECARIAGEVPENDPDWCNTYPKDPYCEPLSSKQNPPARVTVQPPYQGPPPIGWVYGPYTQCANSPQCSIGVVNVDASGLNVRATPNGPPVMALVNGTLLYPVRKEGPWLLVAPACDLTPTWAWSWNAGVPLNRCWVYF
jgi:hypothetical protein